MLALALVVLTVPESAMVTYGEEVQVTEATEATDAEVDVDTAASGEVDVVADDAVVEPADEVAADVDAEAEASDAVVEDVEAVETDAETTVDADAETDTAAEKGAEVDLETDVITEKGAAETVTDNTIVLIKGEKTSDKETLEKAVASAVKTGKWDGIDTDKAKIGLVEELYTGSSSKETIYYDKTLTPSTYSWTGSGAVVSVTPEDDGRTAVIEALSAGTAVVTLSFKGKNSTQYEINYHVTVLDLKMGTDTLPQNAKGLFVATMNHVNALQNTGGIGGASPVAVATQNDVRIFNVTKGGTSIAASWSGNSDAKTTTSTSKKYITISYNNSADNIYKNKTDLTVTANEKTPENTPAYLSAEVSIDDPYTGSDVTIKRTLGALITVVEHATGLEGVKSSSGDSGQQNKAIDMKVGGSEVLSVREANDSTDIDGRTITLQATVSGEDSDTTKNNAGVFTATINGDLKDSDQISIVANKITVGTDGKYSANKVGIAITAYESIEIGKEDGTVKTEAIPVGYLRRVINIQDSANLTFSENDKKVITTAFNVFQTLSGQNYGNTETISFNNPSNTKLNWYSTDEDLVTAAAGTPDKTNYKDEVIITPARKGKIGSAIVYATTGTEKLAAADIESKAVLRVNVNVYGLTLTAKNGGTLSTVNPEKAGNDAQKWYELDLGIQATSGGYATNNNGVYSGGVDAWTISGGEGNYTKSSATFNDYSSPLLATEVGLSLDGTGDISWERVPISPNSNTGEQGELISLTPSNNNGYAYEDSKEGWKYVSGNSNGKEDGHYDHIVKASESGTVTAVMPGYQYLKGTITYDRYGNGGTNGKTYIYVLVHVNDIGVWNAEADVEYKGDDEENPIVLSPGESYSFEDIIYSINGYQVNGTYDLQDKDKIQKVNASGSWNASRQNEIDTVAGADNRLVGIKLLEASALTDGDVYKIPFTYITCYSGERNKNYSVDVTNKYLYVKVLNVPESDLTATLNETQDENVFLFEKSAYKEVEFKSFSVGTTTYAFNTDTFKNILAKYPLSAESSKTDVATVSISDNNEGRAIVDITPKSVGTSTVTVKAGTKEIAAINVTVLGVKADGTLLTTFSKETGYTDDYETKLVKFAKGHEDSVTLTLTDGTNDITSNVKWVVSGNDTAKAKASIENGVVKTTDMTDTTVEIGVTYTPTIEVNKVQTGYTVEKTALVHIDYVEPGVDFDTPKIVGEVKKGVTTEVTDMQPANEMYLLSGLKDDGDYIDYNDIVLKYTVKDGKGDSANTVDAAVLDLKTQTNLENRNKVEYAQIIAGRIGTYYVTIEAQDKDGNVLATTSRNDIAITAPKTAQANTVTMNDTNLTDEDGKGGYREVTAATASGNNIYVLTNLAPTGFDRSATGTKQFTGFTDAPTLGDIIQSADTEIKDVYGQAKFNAGWKFQSDATTLVSDATKSQKSVATIPIVYTNVAGNVVKGTSGSDITSEVTFLINTIDSITLDKTTASVKKATTGGSTSPLQVKIKRDFATADRDGVGSETGNFAYLIEKTYLGKGEDALFSYTANSEYIEEVKYDETKKIYEITPTSRVGKDIVVTLREGGFTNRLTIDIVENKTEFETFSITTGMDISSNDTSVAEQKGKLVGWNYNESAAAGEKGDGKWYVDISNDTIVKNNEILTVAAWIPLDDVSGNTTKFVTGVATDSTDTNVAKIGAATLSSNNLGYEKGKTSTRSSGGYGIYFARVTLVGVGETTLTLTAQDGTGASVIEIPLVVVNSVPTLKAATFNSNTGIGTVKYEFPGGVYDFTGITNDGDFTVGGDLKDTLKTGTVKNGNIQLKKTDSTKTLTDPDYPLILSTQLTVAPTIDKTAIVTESGAAAVLQETTSTQQVTKQTFKLTLDAISRTVENSDFSATAVGNAYNLFYNDAADVYLTGRDANYAYVRFESNDVDIKDVKIIDSNLYKVKNFANGLATIEYIGTPTKASDLKAAVKAKAKKVTFSIDASDAGYPNPFYTTATLNVVYSAPKFTIASKSATVYPALEGAEPTAVQRISSTSAYEANNLDQLTVKYGSLLGSDGVNPSTIGVVKITTEKTANEKLIVTDGLNWRIGTTAYSFKYKITADTKKTPKLALSKSSMVLSTTAKDADGNLSFSFGTVGVTLAGGAALPDTAIHVDGANNKSKALIAAESISFPEGENDDITVQLNSTAIKDGTYKFKVVTDDVTTTPATLTVKITSKSASDITFKKSGKIDILGTQRAIVATPKLKNIDGTITGAWIGTKLDDAGYEVDETDKFEVSVNDNGAVVITPNGLYTAAGGRYSTKTTYSVPIVLEVQDDNGDKIPVVVTKPITFKVSQSKLKAKAIPATATISRGSAGYATVILYAGNGLTGIEEGTLTYKSGTTLISVDKDDYVYDGEKCTMKLKVDSSLGGKNGKAKTYKVQYTLNAAGRSSEQKPITVTLKVKVQ